MRNYFRLSLSIAFAFAFALACAASRGSEARAQGRSVSAERFPGADIGAKINAADRALGSSPGVIVARGGGVIATQIVLSPDHTLRLLAGTYRSTTAAIPVLMKPGSSIVGEGWDKSVITESDAPGQFTVVSAYNNAQRNGAADGGLSIRDVQIKGANPGFNSAPQAISLGNCTNCAVERVWINGTRSIGVQLGGSSALGNFAENSKVVGCLFTRVASQNLALVNGRNITFEGNKFLRPGQANGPGTTSIDLEPNEATDHLENVTIRNNLIDHRGTEMPTTGNGIVAQAGSGTRNTGNILIEGNTIIGGDYEGVVTNHLSNAIYVFGGLHDVTISNNVIRRTGQAGINIEGSRITVVNNRLTDAGGGGIPGFVITALTDSRVENNTYTGSGTGPADSRMVVTASRRNVIRNNPGFAVVGAGG